MKTPKQLIEEYAHDFRDQALPQKTLEEILWAFWKEAEVENRQAHLDQFCAKIMSTGFKDWYNKDFIN